MGRPLKQGLDYFSVDVDFFQSAKVRRIIKAQSFKSTSVLICLLSNIYRKDGYFLKWDENMPFLIADELGVGAEERMVTEVLQKALAVDFFDAGIFEEYGVLTSEGIQERFFASIERRKKIEIIKEFFLLDPSDVSKNAVWKSATTMPFFKKKRDFEVNVDNNSINASKNSVNVDINQQSKVKESKVKERESKVEEGVNVGKNSVNVDINSVNVNKNQVNVDKNPATTYPQPLSAAVLDAYQKNIRPICSEIERSKLADDVERYGETAVLNAIERAVIRGKRNIGYMEGILKRWESNGYDDVDAKQGIRQAEDPQIAKARRAIEMLQNGGGYTE